MPLRALDFESSVSTSSTTSASLKLHANNIDVGAKMLEEKKGFEPLNHMFVHGLLP